MTANSAQITWSGYRGPGGRFAARAEAALTTTLDSMGYRLLQIAQREAPVSHGGDPSHPPGRLRSELRIVRADQAATGTLTLDSPTPYARWVLGGRGPIEAQGRALRFWIGGRLLFRKRVGPVAPNPYITRTWEAWWPTAQQDIRGLVARFSGLLLEGD